MGAAPEHDGPRLEVYRAPMRSRRDDVDHAGAVAWALESGIVAVGGVLSRPPRGADDAVELLRREQDDRLADRLARFIAVEISSFVWTRTDDLGYRLGRVHGPWAYDASPVAARHDLPHTRACRWLDGEIPVDLLPADVEATFGRGGRNFQRVRSVSAEHATEEVWRRCA